MSKRYQKKRLICLSDRQEAVLSDLSEEIGISMSELIRRGLDTYVEGLIKDGTLVRFTFSTADKSIDLVCSKDRFKQLYEYVKQHPETIQIKDRQ